MLRRMTLLPSLLALSAFPLSAQSAGQNIDDVVPRALELASTPGAVVAIVVRDSVAFMRPYGTTALNAGGPLDASALFNAAPLGELLNALAAAKLAHDGALDLNEPLGSLISELPRELRDVTVEQLLTHTAGMSHQLAVQGRGGADDLGAAARGLTRFDRVAPGGVLYSFSNPGISLAGLAIERAAKRSYAAAMRALLLEPLGLQHSTFVFADAEPALARGWLPSTSPDSPVLPATFRADSAAAVPRSGFHTTAADAARLAAALLSDGVIAGTRVLPEGVAASLLEPRHDVPFSTTQAALGVRMRPWHGRNAIVIAGGAKGHGFSMHLLPAERVGVVVVTNKAGSTLPAVADFVFRRLVGEPPRAERPARTPPDPALLDRLAASPGSYVNGSELIEIVVRDGAAMLKSDDLILPIRPLEDGAFAALIDGRVALTFRIIADDLGRTYLWIGDRALAREEPKPPARS